MVLTLSLMATSSALTCSTSLASRLGRGSLPWTEGGREGEREGQREGGREGGRDKGGGREEKGGIERRVERKVEVKVELRNKEGGGRGRPI